MDKLKIISFLLIIWPIFLFGQKSTYPKDTIYVLYEKQKANRKIMDWDYNNNNGVYFSIKDEGNKYLSLFYPYTEKADTLHINNLKEFRFSDLEEINEKRNKWIFDNKRPPGTRNGVFQTYVLEMISDKKIVKYPVIWRNERT